MNIINFKTKGICARLITIAVEDGIIVNVSFVGGCEGNVKGIGKLVEGMPVNKVIEKLRGIDCEGKGTSCPDQLAKALEEAFHANTSIA